MDLALRKHPPGCSIPWAPQLLPYHPRGRLYWFTETFTVVGWFFVSFFHSYTDIPATARGCHHPRCTVLCKELAHVLSCSSGGGVLSAWRGMGLPTTPLGPPRQALVVAVLPRNRPSPLRVGHDATQTTLGAPWAEGTEPAWGPGLGWEPAAWRQG